MANLSPVVCRLHEKENAQKTKEFRGDYYPYCDTLLTRINWGGTRITRKALESVAKDKMSRITKTYWEKPKVDHSPYKKWIDYWREG